MQVSKRYNVEVKLYKNDLFKYPTYVKRLAAPSVKWNLML